MKRFYRQEAGLSVRPGHQGTIGLPPLVQTIEQSDNLSPVTGHLVILSIEQYLGWTIFAEITPSGKRMISALKVAEAEGPGGISAHIEAHTRQEVIRQIDLREVQPDYCVTASGKE